MLLHILLSFTIHYFIFHFKCFRILNFAICQLLCWAFLFCYCLHSFLPHILQYKNVHFIMLGCLLLDQFVKLHRKKINFENLFQVCICCRGMKAREASRRFSDSKKRLTPGEVLRKMSWRRVVCEKLSRRLQEFGKKLLGVQRVNSGIKKICKRCAWTFGYGTTITGDAATAEDQSSPTVAITGSC